MFEASTPLGGLGLLGVTALSWALATAAGRALEGWLRAAHLRRVAVLQTQSFPGDHPDIAEHLDLVPMGLPSARYLLGTAAHHGSRPVLVAGRGGPGHLGGGTAGGGGARAPPVPADADGPG